MTKGKIIRLSLFAILTSLFLIASINSPTHPLGMYYSRGGFVNFIGFSIGAIMGAMIPSLILLAILEVIYRIARKIYNLMK